MTKKDIVRIIAGRNGLTQLQVKNIVQRVLDEVIDAIVFEGRIELRNFGVFEVKQRAARKARNPRTGEKVQVPARRVVKFIPGQLMKKRVSSIELV